MVPHQQYGYYSNVLEEQIKTHSSILAWKIPWTEGPNRLQSMEPQRVGHDWGTRHFLRYVILWQKGFFKCYLEKKRCCFKVKYIWENTEWIVLFTTALNRIFHMLMRIFKNGDTKFAVISHHSLLLKAFLHIHTNQPKVWLNADSDSTFRSGVGPKTISGRLPGAVGASTYQAPHLES